MYRPNPFARVLFTGLSGAGHSLSRTVSRALLAGLLFILLLPPAVLAQSAATDSSDRSFSPATWAVRAGAGYAIAGEGDQTAPLPHLDVTARLAGPLHLTGRVSVFHDDAWSESLSFGAARLTYGALDVGARVYPISTPRHRLAFTLAPSVRMRASKRVVATHGFVGEPGYLAIVEEYRGTDVGYAMGMEYGVRLFGSTAFVAEMRGAGYREGTSVFLFGFGLQVGL